LAKLSALKPQLLPPRPQLTTPPKIAENFYASREWRDLVASMKRERGNRCARCGASGRIIGDHIVERRDGGAELDRNNIELLCMPHHAAKTAAARKARARGQV
jgi:5-methylcytosine-specific restriction protein A